MIDRRKLLTGAAVAGAAAFTTPRALFADDKPSPIDPELVGELVAKSHFDLPTVRSLLAKEPALINAAWDWGGGDWETGLGAAAHVGRPDIANFLLDHGARIDVFAATMLGHTTIVKAFLDEIPTIHRVPGPHGIPLLSHAVAGREAASDLVTLLLERGAEVDAASSRGMTPLMMAASIGSLETIDLLLTRGADPRLTDSESRNALDWALHRDQPAAAERLRKALSPA